MRAGFLFEVVNAWTLYEIIPFISCIYFLMGDNIPVFPTLRWGFFCLYFEGYGLLCLDAARSSP